MIRIIRSRTLRQLREKATQLDEIVTAQREAEKALTSPVRAERRRAHRQLWSELPVPEGDRG